MIQNSESATALSQRQESKPLFDRKLLAYAAAASAAAVAGQSAQAVVMTRNINTTVATGSSYDLDVDGNGTTDYVFTSTPYEASVQGTGTNQVIGHSAGYDSFKANRLTTSHYVPGSAATGNSATLAKTPYYGPAPSAGSFAGGPAAAGALGLSFAIGSTTHYGFADISVASAGAADPYAITINSVSWETDPGVPIHVITGSVVPEPAGLAALALGAAGLVALRRRRKTV